MLRDVPLALVVMCGAGCVGTSARNPAAVVTPAPVATSGPNTRAAAPARDGGAAAQDDWPTVLSSRKWRFASFFNRVKYQVAAHWFPEAAYRRRDPTGAVYGRQNRYTELRITLNPDGRLMNIALTRTSGLDFLDDEAIEAFKEAQPFARPPRQFIDNHGLVRFHFGFLFDPNGPPQMRWFRDGENDPRAPAQDAGVADGQPDGGAPADAR